MRAAQELLKMIETADPSDTAKLDEIDWAVMQFLYPELKLHVVEGLIYSHDGTHIRREFYARSRDALKEIRPQGYQWQHLTYDNGQYSTRAEVCPVTDKSIVLSSPRFLPTEELAELHAIIQAIDYERRQANVATTLDQVHANVTATSC
jgi:hypothetical protein